jgi:TP901 family phage tail tape measure protein
MANLIEIVISGRNEAKTALAEAKKDGEGLASSMSKMGVVGGAALVGIGVEAAKMATSYEASTTRLATSAGESTGNLKMVGQGMLDMAGKVGTSAEELSKGMYTVESSGYHGADALTVLKSAAQGAKDENANLATVANAVTDVLVDYHLKASDAADVTSKMVTAVSFGKTTFEDFSGSMHNILPLASAMHLSFADVSGVLAEMTAHGMSADQASQNMANAMRSLIAPTKAQTTEFAKLGTSAEEVRTHLSTVGLSGTMQYLSEVAKKVGPNVLEQEAALKKLMGTAPGLSVALMTTGENFDATTKAIKGISGASADAQGNVKGFSEVQQTLAFKVAAAKASFESLMTELGQKLLPVLKDVMDWMNRNHDVVVLITEVVVGLTVALAAYTIGVKVAAAASAIFEGAMWLLNAALDANPIVLIGLAIVALGVILYELITHWKTVWGEVKKVAEDVGKFLSKVWGDVKKDAAQIWANIVATIENIWGDLTDAWNKTGGKVVAAISNAWDQVSATVSQEWDHITADLSSIWNNLVELWNDTVGKIITGAKEAMDFLYGNVFKPAWDLISRLFMDNLKIIEGFVKAWLDTVKAIIKIAWDVVYGIIKTAWDLISGYVSGSIDVIKGVLKAGWDVITGAVKVAWDLIRGFINTPLDFIKDQLQLFTDFFTGHWSKLWTDVKKTVADLWHNIYTMIKGTLGAIKDAVVSSAGDIIGGLITGVGKALGGVKKAFGDVLATVKNVFSDAIHWLYQAGKDIIQGLINGISSTVGDLGGALGNIASQVGSVLNPVNWFAHGGEVGHAAVGGPRSGLTMVGEHGPELVRLPTGSTVRSNPDTMAQLAGGGGGGGGVAALEWIGPTGDEFFEMFKKWIRVRTGAGPNSVQQALGQTW